MTGRRYNAALVRYQTGHTYVDRSDGGQVRELYLEMGGIADRQVAREIAARVLALYRSARETVAVSGPVRTSLHVPSGETYQLGDKMDGAMIRSYAVALEGDGLVSITPELDDPLAVREAAIQRQLARASSGLRSEWAKPNVVDPTAGTGTDSSPSEFSLSGQVVTSLSPAWRAPRPWWCAWLDVQLVTAGAGVTRVDLRKEVGGVWPLVAQAVLGSGDTRAIVAVNRGWAAGERLVLSVPEAAGGAADLTATLRGTMV